MVVLVDDLDRCLPDAVTATLEAIKLFLSTEKMVFVLAARAGRPACRRTERRSSLNPRQIKRFLNAFGVRESIARARGVTIPSAVMIKMLLLEELHRTSFNTLAAAPVQERKTILARWQA